MSMLRDNESLFLCNGNKVFCPIILLHFFSFLHKICMTTERNFKLYIANLFPH